MNCPQKRIENTLLEIVRFRDKDKELIIDSYAIASKLGVEQRQIRRAMSNLRKRLITFMPTKAKGKGWRKKGLYLFLDENNPEHMQILTKYVQTSIKHMRTMYFNDVVKYLPIIKDDKLKNEIGQMYLALKGETNE